MSQEQASIFLLNITVPEKPKHTFKALGKGVSSSPNKQRPLMREQSKESFEKIRRISPKRDTMSAGLLTKQIFRRKLVKQDQDALQDFMNKSSINFYNPRPSNLSEGPTRNA
jgi:hypothetical protein